MIRVLIALLARAAATSPAPPPPAPPGATEVDDYVCYKVRPTSGAPRFVETTVLASDALDPTARALRLVRPRTLCVPADLGTSPQHPATALLCYVAKGAPGTPPHSPLSGLQVSDAFGPLDLHTIREILFCLPAGVTP